MMGHVFGRNLKRTLDSMRMSQKELADKACLTEAAISQIIAGKRDPRLSSVCAILLVLPVTFEKMCEPRHET